MKEGEYIKTHQEKFIKYIDQYELNKMKTSMYTDHNINIKKKVDR